jgi:uncharacterized protein YdaU (DUF1376 family)
MGKPPFMQVWVADFLAETAHLSAEQIGAFVRLLLTMWAHGGSLSSDTVQLARIAHVDRRSWKLIWPRISSLFEVRPDSISNARLTAEYEKATSKSAQRSASGQRGGHAKALKDKEAGLANASALPWHSSDTEIEKKVDDDPYATAASSLVGRDVVTFREKILTIIGVDPSGRTGPGGGRLGGQGDMMIAGGWVKDLGLTEEECLAEIAVVMQRKGGAPPSSFRYFSGAMQELAALKKQPGANTTTIKRSGRHGRHQSDRDIRRLADDLSAGHAHLEADGRDPFPG